MSQMIRKFYLLLLFCTISVAITAQKDVRFEAETDARQIVLSGYFTLTFTIHNAEGTDFKPPSFRDFKVTSGPNPKTRVLMENGRITESRGLSYLLQPRKIGKFTIGPATIKANGQTLRTNPINIEVVKGKNSKASTREDLEAELGNDVFIKAEVNTSEARIGEQILLDYKLYTTQNIESYNLISESDYAGFFAQDVRRFNGRVVKEVVDGKQFSTKVLKRVALFPQQGGKLTIDPMVMQLYINSESPNQRRSAFFLPKMTPIRVNTDSLHISIKSLPADKPPTFTGAVGKFSIRANINRRKLTTDDAILLRLDINGNGDIKQIQAPPLTISDNFEVYDPKVLEENSFENNGAYSVKKTFEYTILPNEPGTYDLSVAFTYFDTDSLKYKTLSTDTTKIIVGKGVLGAKRTPRSVEASEAREDIRFIKLETNLKKEGDEFLGSYVFWTLFILPILLLAGVVVQRQILISRNAVDILVLKRNRAKKVAQKRLSLSRNFLKNNDSKDFYDEVSKASFGYICDKLSIPLSDLTKDNVIEKLSLLKVSEESISLFMKTIKTCELALFAGKDNADAMNETYDSAIDVIAKIEEEIGG